MVQLLLCVCDVQMKIGAWLRGHTLTIDNSSEGFVSPVNP